MRKVFFYFLFLAHLFANEEVALCTLASDPATIVADSVNAITGQMVLSENDLVIKAKQPLILPRSYTSVNRHRRGGGWDFYPHLRLELYKKYKKKKLKNEYFKVRDTTGVLYRFKRPKKDRLFHLDFERQKQTLVNTSSGIISGETNIRNAYIAPGKNPDVFILTTGDGTRRYYRPRLK